MRDRRRSHGSRQRARSVLIVTNGEITERAYLHELKQRAQSAQLKVKIEVKVGEPVTVVRKYTSPAGDISGYDEIWFVFDEDGKDLSGALRLVRGSDSRTRPWTCVVTRPCFEVWLTAHYTQVRAYADQHDAQRHYEQVSRLPKGRKELPESFPFDAMQEAARRCQLVDGMPSRNEMPPSPGSAMPLLLEALGLLGGQES